MMAVIRAKAIHVQLSRAPACDSECPSDAEAAARFTPRAVMGPALSDR